MSIQTKVATGLAGLALLASTGCSTGINSPLNGDDTRDLTVKVQRVDIVEGHKLRITDNYGFKYTADQGAYYSVQNSDRIANPSSKYKQNCAKIEGVSIADLEGPTTDFQVNYIKPCNK